MEQPAMKTLETEEFRFVDGHWEVNGATPGTPNSKAPPVDHGAAMIRPERYYSREEMELEWDRMWTKTWTTAGRVSDVEAVGDYFTYELGRESFIVVRTGPAQIKAYYNVCHHRGNKLVYNDFGRVSEFVCPFHSWTYGLNGNLKRITDQELFPRSLICDRPGLTEVRCDTFAGFVFINMDDKAEDLRSYLGIWTQYCAPYHLENFRVFSENSMEWNANWKTAIDAFIEAYHSHVVHPEVRAMYDDLRVQYDCYDKGHSRMLAPWGVVSGRDEPPIELTPHLKRILQNFDVDPETYDGPPHSVRKILADAKRRWGTRYGLDFSGLTDSQLLDLCNPHFFPNMTLQLQESSVMLQMWRPHATDPEKCIYTVMMLLPVLNDPDHELVDIASVGQKSGVVKFDPNMRPPRKWVTDGRELGFIINQDVQQIPILQKGLRSRAFKGMRFGDQEIRLRHYLKEIDRYLGR